MRLESHSEENKSTKVQCGSIQLKLDGLSAPLSSPHTHLPEIWHALQEDLHQGKSRFYDAPIDRKISQIDEVNEVVKKFKRNPNLTHCLFIGIGGSSLGPKSLIAALRSKSAIEFVFLENPDPDEWKDKTAFLKPEQTLVCCVTKSGKTFETLSLFLVALQWLGKKRWSDQVVCITDPNKGELRQLSQSQGLTCLEIPQAIGGRYSVFSPVGLFPLALSGWEAESFLEGARQVRRFMETHSARDNIFFHLSIEMIRMFQTYPIHVMMPYCSRLTLFSDWWMQLWAESLGKQSKGFTPLCALGANDQHSLLQLFNQGPSNKLFFFIQVLTSEHQVQIPEFSFLDKNDFNICSLLQGKPLKELLDTEHEAIRRVLCSQNLPQIHLRVERLDERRLGELYFLFCVWTAFTGYAWGINPFDQPGVEQGKIYVENALQVDPPEHSA